MLSNPLNVTTCASRDKYVCSSHISTASASSYAPSIFDRSAATEDRASALTVSTEGSHSSGTQKLSRSKPMSLNTLSSSSDGTFYCTYGCNTAFKGRWEWKRHETDHDPQFKYKCALCPSFICVRRDKILSHLQSRHDRKLDEVDNPHWRYPNPLRAAQWACGFCPEILTDWEERADHISSHFRNGCKIEDWKASQTPVGQGGEQEPEMKKRMFRRLNPFARNKVQGDSNLGEEQEEAPADDLFG